MVLGAQIAADPVEMVGGDVELVVVGVLQYQVLFFFAVIANAGGAGLTGHAVVDVDYKCPRNQIGEKDFGPVFRLARTIPAFLNGAEQLGVG